MYTVGLDEIMITTFVFVRITYLYIIYSIFYLICMSNLFFSFLLNIIDKSNPDNNEGIVIPSLFSDDEIEQVIFGCLLGDAHLEMQNRNVNARLGFVQSGDHFNYFISV